MCSFFCFLLLSRFHCHKEGFEEWWMAYIVLILVCFVENLVWKHCVFAKVLWFGLRHSVLHNKCRSSGTVYKSVRLFWYILFISSLLLFDSFPTKTMISFFWIRIFMPYLYAYISLYKLSFWVRHNNLCLCKQWCIQFCVSEFLHYIFRSHCLFYIAYWSFFIFYILIADETAFRNKKIHSIKPLKGYVMLPQLAGHGTSAVQLIWAAKFVWTRRECILCISASIELSSLMFTDPCIII